jgi:glycosyltransferase involved in cell wall biosynthesis
MEDITVVVANYKHPHFTKECKKAIKKFYPKVPIIQVNDGKPHVGHGVTLDRGIRKVKTKYVVTIDHDARLIKPGVFEALMKKMKGHVAVVGKAKNNWMDMVFISPNLSLWRVDLIKQYNLSFADFIVSKATGGKKPIHFATAQLMSKRLEQQYGYDLAYYDLVEEFTEKIGYARYSKSDIDLRVKRKGKK